MKKFKPFLLTAGIALGVIVLVFKIIPAEWRAKLTVPDAE